MGPSINSSLQRMARPGLNRPRRYRPSPREHELLLAWRAQGWHDIRQATRMRGSTSIGPLTSTIRPVRHHPRSRLLSSSDAGLPNARNTGDRRVRLKRAASASRNASHAAGVRPLAVCSCCSIWKWPRGARRDNPFVVLKVRESRPDGTCANRVSR